MKSDFPGDFSKSRSKVNLTSAEVSSWPSWKRTPSRSVKVHVSPSGLICQDSASSGTGVISASKRTSWLYIMGERRLRENAGTSCGSRPVASVVCAETKVPPGFGACACAGRPTESAARAAPLAFRRSLRVNRVVIAVAPSVSCGSFDVRGSLDVGVEDIAQAVADQVEREHAQHDRDAREDGDPRRGLEVRPPLVQHVPPRGRRRLGREAQVAQRGLDQDRLREGDRPLDHKRGHHVGEHVLERHGEPRRAEGAHRLDVVLLALGQHRPAHDAREEGRVDDRDRDDRAVHAGAHRRDADREEEARDAEEDVHHAVDDVVPGAAEVARREPEHAADGHRDADRDRGDVEGDPRAVDDPAQNVPAEPVGPEERLRPGRRLDQVEVLLVGRAGREAAGEERRGDDHEGHEPTEDDDGAARDAPELPPPQRITRTACSSARWGTATPRLPADLRLTSSSKTGCSIGRSAGLAPLRILAVIRPQIFPSSRWSGPTAATTPGIVTRSWSPTRIGSFCATAARPTSSAARRSSASFRTKTASASARPSPRSAATAAVSSPTARVTSVTPVEGAICSRFVIWTRSGGKPGSKRTARRLSSGSTWRKAASRRRLASASALATPVRLPPGASLEATSFAATGSATGQKTTGIVVVAAR